MGEIFKKELPNPVLSYTGERFTEGHDIETEIEHYHRYFFARSYCRGKDVLDIASGEGYGSAILAQVAASVVGVDICAEAVSHAQMVHTYPNLRYLMGDVCKIPLDDQSVDVVVSFETLEHFYEHDLFMQEVKRVLRPDGQLIISTPNSDIYSAIGIPANPYHVNELTKIEFTGLCRKYFKYMSLLNQRTLVGSVLVGEGDTAELPILFESRGQDYVESSKGLSRAFYLISILSDVEHMTVHNSIYINGGIRDSLNSTSQLFHQMLTEKNRHIENLEHSTLHKDKHIENLEHSTLHKDKHIENLENTTRHKDKHIENLENMILDKDRQIKYLKILIEGKEQHVFQQNNESHDFQEQSSKSAITWIRKKILSRKEIRICSKSTYFDASWYLAQYPDVKESGINPVVHYVQFGALEQRDPGPNFSTKNYLKANPKVRKKGINPLFHFEQQA